jgi:hypothetical protein
VNGATVCVVAELKDRRGFCKTHVVVVATAVTKNTLLPRRISSAFVCLVATKVGRNLLSALAPLTLSQELDSRLRLTVFGDSSRRRKVFFVGVFLAIIN